MTKKGLELQLGTNRIGHFLFTNLVLSNILRRGQATGRMRVVNVRGAEHKRDVRFDDSGLRLEFPFVLFIFPCVFLKEVADLYPFRLENATIRGRPIWPTQDR